MNSKPDFEEMVMIISIIVVVISNCLHYRSVNEAKNHTNYIIVKCMGFVVGCILTRAIAGKSLIFCSITSKLMSVRGSVISAPNMTPI